MSAIESTDRMSWIAKCKTCNEIVACSVEDPQYAVDNAKFVSKLIRQGYDVSKVTVDAVRQGVWCSCERPRKKESR